ncbi:ATP-binding protein [Sphaerotilaceae bacterium SBD11-9]
MIFSFSRTLLRSLAGLILACLLWAPAWGQALAPIELTEAEFTPAGSTESTPVTLPDTWGMRGLSPQGAGRYHLRFTLDAVPAQPWAVSFTRISIARRLFLNGQMVQGDDLNLHYHPAPAVIDLPLTLLKPGVNTIDIEVAYRLRGGLSPMQLGPSDEVREGNDRYSLWHREIPRSLNLAIAMLAVLMLLIRWRRPSERTIGWFGVLAFLGSLRNYSYFADVALLPVMVADWFFFSAQVVTVSLLFVFVRSLRPAASAWPERWLGIAATTLVVLAAAFAPFGYLPLFRSLAYPLLMVLGAITLVVLGRAVNHFRDLAHWTLAFTFAGIFVAGVHDHAFNQGWLPLTGGFWMPWFMPFGMGAYALILMGRFVSAVGEVERLNAELEHRVQQRTRALQTAHSAKSRFIASASHDLRQPVAAIGLMVGLLREQIAVPRLQNMIDRVDEAVASMETMLKGLLDLSRLESGTVQARPQRVVLQTLFDAIAVHEGEAAQAKGLTLRFRPTSVAVQSDPVMLEQILRNLVSNAVRYTERGGVLVAARKRAGGAQAGQVLLQVVDSGVGIAPEHQASVFDEFVQLGNSARQRTRGFGLGLSIVKRSAEVLGHPLMLRSRPGHGTIIGLLLPRGQDERRARPRHAAPSSPLIGLRIVLVEDDASVRESLSERLQAWGASVQAFDGVPSLRAALPPAGSVKDGRFTDLLITDQRLPGGSGLLVIELVRQRCGATRAMVVTGDTSPGDLNLLADSGLPVLHKPFRAEELLAAIGRALDATALGELPA